LDERGDLAVVITMHVADPKDFGDVGLVFLLEQETGGGGSTVEEQGCFLGLDEDT